MRLNDRVAIVTGAGQGIGRAIALKMAQEGAWVGVLDWNRKTGEDVLKEIKEKDGQGLFLSCDVSDRSSVDASVKRVVEICGRVDILVNNAGIDRPAAINKVTEQDWDSVHKVHLKGSLYMTQAVLNFMLKRAYGKIVNISSVYGRSGGVAAISYSAAKGGLIGLTKATARELGRYGINVNAVLPGLILTPTISKMPTKYRDQIVAETAFGRMGEAMEVANVVAFLASDEAGFMTGACVEVTGGWRI